MLVSLNDDTSVKEVYAHPDLKRNTINQLISRSVNEMLSIYFIFPLVLGEQNIHVFELDSSSDNYSLTCSSLRQYLKSFSNEVLNTVRILVEF